MARRAHNPRGDEHLRALERGMVAGELTPAWHAAWERAGRPGRDPRLEPRAGDVFLTRRTHDGLFHMTTHPIAAEFWNGDATPLQVVSGDAATVVSAIVDAVRS